VLVWVFGMYVRARVVYTLQTLGRVVVRRAPDARQPKTTQTESREER
jgi:hypothetical protein